MPRRAQRLCLQSRCPRDICRPLRPRLQGLHPRPGPCGLRQPGRRTAPRQLHRGHHRRRDPHVPRSERLPRGGRRPDRLQVLGLRFRRYRRREQAGREDHRRPYRHVFSGLFRLRLPQVRRRHHIAPAFRQPAHPLFLPHRLRRLHRLPQPVLCGQVRPSAGHQGRRRLPAELHVEGRGSGKTSARFPAPHHRPQEDPLLHAQRSGYRHGPRPRRTHQHAHASRLLQAGRHHPPQ